MTDKKRRYVREFTMTREEILKLMVYDQNTGDFYWRAQGRPRGKTFDAKFAGTKAGFKIASRAGRDYWAISIGGEWMRAHRLAWFLHYGVYPPQMVDHEDRDGLNNAISNLRLADASQNSANTTIRATNTSGVQGVYKTSNKSKPWRAKITFRKVSHEVGSFACKFEAHEAWKVKMRELHGEFFPG